MSKLMGPQAFVETEAIFIEVPSTFHEVADLGSGWIQFLPQPGTYVHPKFGDVVITPERNKRMVDSVKSQVYQEKIPLDLEHDLKVSGAVGWISDMRLNEDGSADAFVEWTDRGQEVRKGNRFRYISPEWFRQWKDPATGQEHQDVVAGGALTTRPFFKDKVLRALVASERGVEVVGREQFAGGNGSDDEMDDQTDEESEEADEAPEDESGEDMTDEESEEEEEFVEPEGFSEAQASAIEAYVEARIATVSESFAEQLKAETTKRETAEKALRVLTDERRRERFTELVRNRDAGAPWVGGVDKHVPVLEKFAETFGEDSDAFTDYVELQRQTAEQVKASQAFSEIGSSASASTDGSGPMSRLNAMAAERQKAAPTLTREQAFSEVVSTPEGARLYAETIR
jgi:hypothetical protein